MNLRIHRLEDGAIHLLPKLNKCSSYAFGQKRRRDSGFFESSLGPSAKRQKIPGAMNFDQFKEEVVKILYETKKRGWMVTDQKSDGSAPRVREEWSYFIKHFKVGGL